MYINQMIHQTLHYDLGNSMIETSLFHTVLHIILFQDNSDVLPHRSCCGNQQAPYSPDFNPAIYFMFPMLNTALKGSKFQDTKDNKNS